MLGGLTFTTREFCVTILKRKSSIRTIRKGDHRWMITDGHMVSPRAGFEIDRNCYDSYVTVIRECIANGWLKPVAFVREDEFMWETLNED